MHADEPRRVWITVHDHAHTYEIAWTDTAAGPVITDLRVRSANGAPITSESLRRINTDTLLRAAVRHDTTEDAAAARELRESFDAAIGDSSVDTSGIESLRFTDGIVDALVRHAPPGAALPTPQPRRGGRPKLSREFLVQVADWARDGRANGHAVYPYVADRAADHLGRDVADETVKGWIRRARDAGLLAPDDLRKPRTPSATTTDPEQEN